MDSLEYKKIVKKEHYGLPYKWWLTFEDGTQGWSDLDVEIGGYLAYDDGDTEKYYTFLGEWCRWMQRTGAE